MNPIIESLNLFARRRPRMTAAIAFGCTTAVVTHFSWFPVARMNGYIPVLTLATGLCHALAGLITGSRLIDRTRTRTSLQACLLGGVTSLLAMAFLAPPLALWVSSSNTQPESVLTHLYMTILVGLFSFLAVGRVLLLVSVFVGWVLYRITAPQTTNQSMT